MPAVMLPTVAFTVAVTLPPIVKLDEDKLAVIVVFVLVLSDKLVVVVDSVKARFPAFVILKLLVTVLLIVLTAAKLTELAEVTIVLFSLSAVTVNVIFLVIPLYVTETFPV